MTAAPPRTDSCRKLPRLVHWSPKSLPRKPQKLQWGSFSSRASCRRVDSAETAVFSNRVSNGASEHAFGSAAAVPVNNDMGSSPFPILRRRQAKTPTTPPHQRGKTEARAGAMATASRFTTHRGDSDQTVPAGRSDLQLRMLLSCVTSPAALAHTWARSCSNMCFNHEAPNPKA